jgi:hypothetical protein
VDALGAVVFAGLDDGTISDRAAEQISHDVEEALRRFEDGEIDEAIDHLERLEGRVDELVDHDEIAHSQERKLDKAIEELARQMLLAGDD